jgi:hypothetical protein
MAKDTPGDAPHFDESEDFNDSSVTAEASWRGLLGQILFENGMIDGSQWDAAEMERRQTGRSLGEILVARGVITPIQLQAVIAGRRELDSPSLLPPPRPSTTPPLAMDWPELLELLEKVRREIRARLNSYTLSDELREHMERVQGPIETLIEQIENDWQPREPTEITRDLS